MIVAQNQKPNLHDTVAHTAAHDGNFALLLAHLDQFPGDVNARNDAKDTPLHLAASRGHLDCVKLLIERGAKLGHEEINGWTPLICAVNTGRIEVAEYLLDHRAGIRHTCELGWNVLHFAAFGNYKAMVSLLLGSGAKPLINDETKDHKTPLDLALQKLASEPAYATMVALLKASGAEKGSVAKELENK